VQVIIHNTTTTTNEPRQIVTKV